MSKKSSEQAAAEEYSKARAADGAARSPDDLTQPPADDAPQQPGEEPGLGSQVNHHHTAWDAARSEFEAANNDAELMGENPDKADLIGDPPSDGSSPVGDGRSPDATPVGDPAINIGAAENDADTTPVGFEATDPAADAVPASAENVDAGDKNSSIERRDPADRHSGRRDR